jgi:uncharacterized transporter YbjL
VHDLRRFFRENPQVLVLLLICLILGLGTFFAVVFGLIAAGKNAQVTGEPSGALPRAPALVAQAGGPTLIGVGSGDQSAG